MGTYIFANLFINNKLFQNIGKNTTYILGLHFLLVEVSVSMMVYFIANIGITNTFVQNLLVILIDLFLCCGLAELYKIVKGLVVAKLKKGTQQNKE
jgi:fucose 4-O-acetylase-like acetyltransferase